MARIRTLKPSFWGSAEVAKLSRDARLFTIGLISMADDDGRFLASIAAINGYIYPNDDLDRRLIKRWLDDVTHVGMVHLYDVDGLAYGCFPSWHKHQVINRYTPSILPAPLTECAPRKAGGNR